MVYLSFSILWVVKKITHLAEFKKNYLQFQVTLGYPKYFKSNSISPYYEWPFYPTLRQDGDTYELVLDENSDRVLESAELTYSAPEKKSMEIFRKIEFS